MITIIESLIVIVPTLIGVAYVTIAERKTMASMQRRLGPIKWFRKITALGVITKFRGTPKIYDTKLYLKIYSG